MTQYRVIGALMVREMISLHGRRGLGFAWVILEPLIFAVPVLITWSYVRSPYEHGVKIMPFLWSGYLGILLFRHLGGRSLKFVRTNAGLLYHRRVTIFDVFLARALLEIGTNIFSLVTVFLIFYQLGEIDVPVDYPLFVGGYLIMIWWCFSIGLLVGVLSERIEWFDKIWGVYSYLYLIFSGCFYMADWLPPGLRRLALYQPSLQAYEIIRAGTFGSGVPTHGDPAYVCSTLAVMTLLGLWLFRDIREHVVLE